MSGEHAARGDQVPREVGGGRAGISAGRVAGVTIRRRRRVPREPHRSTWSGQVLDGLGRPDGDVGVP